MRPGADTTVRMKRKRIAIVAFAVVVLDLSSKVVSSLFLPTGVVDLPGVLDLSLSHNRGIAVGAGNVLPGWLLVAVTAAITAAVGVAAWRGVFASATGAALVLGGAVANVLDRVEGGTVVDMLHLGWWPTFNLADVSITLGCIVLLIGESRLSRTGRTPEPLTSRSPGGLPSRSPHQGRDTSLAP